MLDEPSPVVHERLEQFNCVVRFREHRAIAKKATERAKLQGTSLATIMRSLLREWLAGKGGVLDIYKEDS